VCSSDLAERLGQLPDPVEARRRADDFGSWWTSCLDHARVHCRASTVARKIQIGETHLIPAFGPLRLRQITPALVDHLQTRLLGEGLKPATVMRVREELHWCLERAIRLGQLVVNPLVRVDAPKVRQAEQEWTFLSDDELAAYEKAAEAEHPTWRALLLAAVRTGLRDGELCGLQWSSVDLERRVLTVTTSRTKLSGKRSKPSGGDLGGDLGGDSGGGRVVEGPPKSGRGRAVGISPQLLALLRELPSRFAGGYVFLDPRTGGPISPDQVRHPHLRVLTRAGIARHVRPHDLRHTWASHMAMRGAPLAKIQKLGGWSDYRMVLRYAHLSTESVVDQVDVLDGPRVPTKVPTKRTKSRKESP
jgi:integrase